MCAVTNYSSNIYLFISFIISVKCKFATNKNYLCQKSNTREHADCKGIKQHEDYNGSLVPLCQWEWWDLSSIKGILQAHYSSLACIGLELSLVMVQTWKPATPPVWTLPLPYRNLFPCWRHCCKQWAFHSLADCNLWDWVMPGTSHGP